MSNQEVEIALLKNNQAHTDQRLKELEEDFSEVIKVLKKNNDLISKSKGAVWGAALMVSVVWGAGIAIWGMIK